MGEIDPRKLVDQELKIIRRIFDEQKTVEPMVVLIKDEGRVFTPVSFMNNEHKDIVSEGIKALVGLTDPDVVIYMAEAWCVRGDKDMRIDGIVPSEHPERTEMIIVRIEFKTGQKYDCIADITREKGIASLTEFTIIPGDCSMGRFVDFYPTGKAN